MQTDIIGVSIGIVGIIIGVLVSYYFYRLSLRIKEPCWRIRSNNVIEGYSDKVEGLSVLFKSETVKNLTISKILFWNNGADAIYKQDIETANRLRIESAENIKILDAKILSSNNPSSQFEVKIAENGSCAHINFEYLNSKHGAVIQIVHTGVSSKDLGVKGDIKGVESIKNTSAKPKWVEWVNKANKSVISKPVSRKFASLLGILVGIAYLVIGTIKIFVPSFLSSLGTHNPSYSPETSRIIDLSAFFVGGPLMLIMGISVLRPITPKGLEIYYAD